PGLPYLFGLQGFFAIGRIVSIRQIAGSAGSTSPRPNERECVSEASRNLRVTATSRMNITVRQSQRSGGR
ncbi:hypothetical protein, partial [Desulfosporosinus burensis]